MPVLPICRCPTVTGSAVTLQVRRHDKVSEPHRVSDVRLMPGRCCLADGEISLRSGVQVGLIETQTCRGSGKITLSGKSIGVYQGRLAALCTHISRCWYVPGAMRRTQPGGNAPDCAGLRALPARSHGD